MTAAQHLWAPIPTSVTSITPVSNEFVADSVSNFLQLHHGELPGDSNATASLVRLIQGLRDPTVADYVKSSITMGSGKKRRHEKSESHDLPMNGDVSTASLVHNGSEPAKKKKKKKAKHTEEL